MTAISRATILEEQAVSITGDGPLKSKKNDILLEYIAFPDPETQSAASFMVALESSWTSEGCPSDIPIDEYPI